jgi:hypothetical protein
MIGAQLTGDIKWYQVAMGSFVFLCLPISYILLMYYSNPSIIFVVIIIVSTISLFWRLLFLKKMIDLDINSFLLKVLLKIILVTAITVMAFYFINISSQNSFIDFFAKSIGFTVINLISIYLIGLDSSERTSIISFLKSKIQSK